MAQETLRVTHCAKDFLSLGTVPLGSLKGEAFGLLGPLSASGEPPREQLRDLRGPLGDRDPGGCEGRDFTLGGTEIAGDNGACMA